MSESVEVAPTIITVSSVSSGKDPGETAIVTPEGHPNIIVKVLTPLSIIATRAARVFIQTMLGLLGATAVTNTLPASDFTHRLVVCAGLSVAATVVCILQNVLELLARFDQKHPSLAG